MPEEPALEPATTQEESGNLLPVSDFETGGITPDTPSSTTSQATPSQGNSQSTQVEPLGIRDVLSQLGFQSPANITDDYTALAHLAGEARQAAQLREQLRQADVYRQLGQQLAPQAEQLQGFLRQQQAPAGPKPWEPPQFDERWLKLVTQDAATGMYVANTGVNPEIARSVNEYADWHAKFQRDPAAVIRPMLDEVRQQTLAEVRQEIQASHAQVQRQSAVQSIVQANAPWFYAYGADGNPMTDPYSGRPQPTPLGVQYLSTLRTLEASGVTDPVAKDQFARAILADQIRQATSGQTVQQTATQRQQNASRGRVQNRGALQALGALDGPGTPGYTAPEQTGMSLGDRMRKAFRENGVDDGNISFLPTG